MNDFTNDQLRQADPSVLAAENGKVETAVNVLRAESGHQRSEWMNELLDAAAEILENEVQER